MHGDNLEERALHINEFDDKQKISILAELAKSIGVPYNKNVSRQGEDIYKDDNGNFIYPPNDGFVGEIKDITLKPDREIKLIDRYGGTKGRYFSPEGTPFEERALPSTTLEENNYHTYKILKSFSARMGIIAGWFDQPGGGIQYLTEKTAQELLDKNCIKEVFKE